MGVPFGLCLGESLGQGQIISVSWMGLSQFSRWRASVCAGGGGLSTGGLSG